MIGKRGEGANGCLLNLLFGIPTLILVFILAEMLLLQLTFEGYDVPDWIALAGAAACIVFSFGMTRLIVRWIVARRPDT